MSALAEKTNLLILIGLFVPIYLSSQYLYLAYTFRFLLFTLSFVLGFYVFSSDKVQDILAKYSAHLLIAGLILGAVQTYIYWGQSFQLIVNEFVVFLFSWIMVLAMLGIFKRRFDQQNRMWTFLNKYSYSFYIFHYLPLTVGGYYIDQWVHAGMIKYLLLFIWTFAASMVMHHIIMILLVVRDILR